MFILGRVCVHGAQRSWKLSDLTIKIISQPTEEICHSLLRFFMKKKEKKVNLKVKAADDIVELSTACTLAIWMFGKYSAHLSSVTELLWADAAGRIVLHRNWG